MRALVMDGKTPTLQRRRMPSAGHPAGRPGLTLGRREMHQCEQRDRHLSGVYMGLCGKRDLVSRLAHFIR